MITIELIIAKEQKRLFLEVDSDVTAGDIERSIGKIYQVDKISIIDVRNACICNSSTPLKNIGLYNGARFLCDF